MLKLDTPPAFFPVDIETSLNEVRDSCRAIIEAVCGTGARAKDVAEKFEIHAKLGWQLWNVAYSPALATLRFLPNEHGIQSWHRAALRRGVPAALLESFEQAAEELSRVMGLHAEDREMFEMLLDAHDPQSEEAEVRWRKQAFIGNSFTFGARAKCMLACGILFPGREPDTFSLARVHGLIDLIRTRAGIRWPFATLVIQHHAAGDTTKREPLDYASPVVPLLLDYCSRPLPPIERRTEDGMISDELLPGVVGLTGAATIFTGEVIREAGPTRGFAPGEKAHFGSGIRTPCELLISDHIVHHSIFPDVDRELRMYSELVSPTSHDDRDRLEVGERLQHLGRGLNRVRTADVPNYAELLEETFKRIGFDPSEFDVYRVRMRYPPIPSSVMVRHSLPA